MPYICFCKDYPGATELRREHTPAHLDYIEGILDRILLAGPLKDPEADGYNASCFIYRTDERSEALELLHNDPYYKAGIFSQVHCRPFIPAAGTLIGGKTW
jgi:uncharacterized protein YciI